MSNPRLFIVAGPNGAGKSLFSNKLSQTDFDVFDGDKYITTLKNKYPETGSEILDLHVNDVIFKEAKRNAIELKLNFAFETNFSRDNPLMSMREFEAAGLRHT